MKISASINNLYFRSFPKILYPNASQCSFKSSLTKDMFVRNTSQEDVEKAKKQVRIKDLSPEELTLYNKIRNSSIYKHLSDDMILNMVVNKFSPEKIKDASDLNKQNNMDFDEIQLYYESQEKYGFKKGEALSFIYNRYTPEEIEKYSSISKSIPTLYEPLKKLGMLCPDFISYGMISNRIFDVADFKKYIEAIDMEKISKISPKVKDYSNRNFSTFISTHYKLNTTNFDESSLSLNGKLNNVLSENYLNASDVENLLVAFPLTSRNIGELPNGWLDKINDSDKEQVREKVFNLCSQFAQDDQPENFQEGLSALLNKKVNVSYCNSGEFGKVYILDVEDSVKTCFKLFKKQTDIYCKNKFGQFVEPQISLFANNYSNDFVKSYFGKISTRWDKDGFMVCQFLSNDVEPEKTGYNLDQSYVVETGDGHDANIINGKIIDYGAVKIYKNGHKFHRWFS